MEELKKQIDVVCEGFFYFLGFSENPATKMAKSTIEDSPSEKIKADIKKVNADFRKKYLELRKEVTCLESES